MTPNTPFCAPLSPISSPLPSARLDWRSPVGSEPAPRLYKPDTINLRSSALICGLVSMRLLTDKTNTDDTDWKDLHGYEISANPCHPRNPCPITRFFSSPQHFLHYPQRLL